ncbi:MAG: DUF805 domain-containing protein [SAR202 cluster bacterium]|nr:DUF805 domain-containing protein [SAR202 cluster bacterium]
MGFSEAILSGFRKYVDFSGRSRRSEYLFWTLFVILAYIIAAIIDWLTTGFVLSVLVLVGTFLPSLAVVVRRLHDIDKSGWWDLIGLIPFVGSIILLAWFIEEGTPGPNRFGAQPGY